MHIHIQVAPQHALYYPMQANQTLAAAQLCGSLTEAAVARAGWGRFSFSASLLATRGRLRVGVLSTQYGANSLGWTLQHVFALQERHAAADSRIALYALSMTASDGSCTRATLQGLGLSVPRLLCFSAACHVVLLVRARCQVVNLSLSLFSICYCPPFCRRQWRASNLSVCRYHPFGAC